MKKRLIVPTFIASLALITGVFSASVQSKTAKKVYAVGDIMEDGGHYAFDIEPEIQGVYAHKFLVPTDSYYNTQKSRSMSILGDIESVWDEYKGKGTTIAVIDDGFDHDHAEYKREDGTSAILSTSRYYYASGSSAAYKEYSEDPTCLDEDWNSGESEWDTHGTNTSTTAAAPMGNGGVVGIAPEADILALKIDMSFAAIKGAISYAISQGVDVINMSLGAYAQSFTDGFNESQSGSSSVSTYLNQVCTQAYNAGIIVVAAAGNEATSVKSYPACNSHVIGVGALAKNNATALAGFTNFNQSETQGDEKNVDILAPGFVYTAGITGTQSKHNATWHDTQGTSFASPIVAGAACLWKEKYPNGTPAEFEAALTSTAAGIGTYKDAKVNPATFYNNSNYQDDLDSNISCGRLDVKALLSDEITNITFTKDSYTVAPNSEGSCDESFPYSITPSFADKTEIVFESSNEDVLMVGENYWISGEEGTVTLTATSKKNSSVYDTCTVNVSSTGGGEESDDDGIAGTFTFGSTGRDISDSTAVTKNGITVQVGKNNGFNTSNVKLAQSNGDFTVTSANANIASIEITDDSGLYGFTVSTGSISNGSWTPPTGGTKSVKFTKSSGKQSTVSKIDVKLEQSSTPTNYTVSFNSNGGTGSMTNATTNGSTYTVPACTFTRTNYTFNKWALGSASGTQYSVGDTITDISSNITLYALWTENQSTGGDDDGELSISENAATSITNNARYVWGTTNTNCINRVDSNWGYLSNTTSEFIIFTAETTDGGFYLKTSDGYIYSSADKKIAIDASSKTKLNLNSDNTVSGGSSIGTYYVNTNIRPYKSNNSYGSAYLFPVTGGGGGDPVTQNYTVSFDSNGGTGSMTNATTNGSSYTVPACTFTRTNYTFDKWALNSATGTKYAVGETISGISSNITLYATWTENQSTGGDDDDISYWTSWISSNQSELSTGGTTLVTALRNKISNVAPGSSNNLSYDDLWDAYATTDGIPGSNGTKIYDMYGGFEFRKGTDQAGSYQNEGDVYNREHSVPKSWFNSNTPAYSDIIHVVPTDGKVNGMRSNNTFGEVNDVSYSYSFPARSYNGVQYQNAGISKLGSPKAISGVTTSESTVFEPDDQYKGDFARIYMYFAVRYGGTTCSATVGSGSAIFTNTFTNANPYVTNYGLALLKKWHESDPVSEKERTRNNGVESLQGNRNPFVDYPEWADKIFGTNTSGGDTPTPTKTLSSISVSGQTTSFRVGETFSFGGTVTAHYSDNSTANVTSQATFSGYNMNAAGDQTVTVSYTEGEVNKTTTYTITVTGSGSGGGDSDSNIYELCTSTDDLVVGSKYVIGNGKSGTTKFMSNVSNTNNRKTTENSVSNNQTTISSETLVLKLGSTTGGYTLETVNYGGTNGYLASAASGSNNYCLVQPTAGIVTISISSSSTTINIGPHSTRNLLSYNGSSATNPIFACYSSQQTSGVCLYKQVTGDSPTPKVNSVTLNESSLNFDLNGTKSGSLTATVDADVGADYTLEWSSSNTSVATISGNSNTVTINAVGVGTSTITASAGGEEATCIINVTDSSPIAVNGVSLNKPTLTLTVGSSETLIPTISPTNATNKNVTWSSSNTSAASVDNNGKVSAIAVGSTTITVTTEDGGYTAHCTVTVTAAPVITYQLQADNTSVPYMSGTNHSVSVGVKLYQYTNGVKGSQVASGTGNVDTSILGPQDVTYVYQSVTYHAEVKVTNVGAIQNGEGSSTTKSSSFTSKEFTANGTKTVGDLTLTLNNNGSYYGHDSTKGQQIGSGSSPATSMTLTTSVSGTITKVIVNTSGASSVNASVSVTVGGTAFKCGSSTSKTISATATDYEFTGSGTGDIVITWTQSSSKALYFKTISVTATTPGEKIFTDKQQAEAYADYFVRLTRTESTCLASDDATKLAGLKEVWSELKTEYEAMVAGSKDSFCSDSENAEILKHYQYIISKFGKSSKYGNDGLEDFVKDSNGNKPVVNSNAGLLNISNKLEPATIVTATVAVAGVVAIGLYFGIKKRKEI